MFGPVPGAGSLPWSRARLVAPIYAASRMRTAVLPNILSDSFGSIPDGLEYGAGDPTRSNAFDQTAYERFKLYTGFRWRV
jgi:hypothetical protein